MPRHDSTVTSASFEVWGDVVIAPSAAIASGVVLEASPGTRLIIQAGVCIGAGAVVQSLWGNLVLAEGVNLGSGVLVLGHGTVGTQTCVGAESTVINPNLAAGEIVAARSLLGDPSSLPSPSREGGAAAAAAESDVAESAEVTTVEEGAIAHHTVVYGRDQVTQLIQTLFPHRRSLS